MSFSNYYFVFELIMEKLFITQQELAEQMGVSEKTVNELIRKDC
jgi:plasmid maintenance system antidote protein VapI